MTTQAPIADKPADRANRGAQDYVRPTSSLNERQWLELERIADAAHDALTALTMEAR